MESLFYIIITINFYLNFILGTLILCFPLYVGAIAFKEYINSKVFNNQKKIYELEINEKKIKKAE